MLSTQRIQKPARQLTKLLCLVAIALPLAACSTSKPANVSGLRLAVGNTVPGTKGKTEDDQERIDEHVARACAAAVYTKSECKRHTDASYERWQELRAPEPGKSS